MLMPENKPISRARDRDCAATNTACMCTAGRACHFPADPGLAPDPDRIWRVTLAGAFTAVGHAEERRETRAEMASPRFLVSESEQVEAPMS
jgi:hypothetical protein